MKKIYINPGHSNTDPGAVSYEQERRLNVVVSNHQRDYLLENYDCEVMMNPGTMGDLYAVCKAANEWGADLFVSNHFNAGGGDGYEAWVYSESRRALGQIFEKHVKAIGQNSRGVKIQPGFIVLKQTNMPAVLNECAFVDNLKDIQDWNDDAELKAMGVALAKATAEFLKLKAKVKKPAEEPKKDTAATGATIDPAKSFTRSYAGTYKVKSADGLRLRAGASTSKAILETMPNGSAFTCYGYHTGNWLFGISASGKKGFCSKSYLVKK